MFGFPPAGWREAAWSRRSWAGGIGCTSAAPCSLASAVGIAGEGDEVIASSGDYQLTTTVEDKAKIGLGTDGVQFHALRTRQAGSRAFISVHILVPGESAAQRAHDLVEQIEAQLHEQLPYATLFTHIEPVDDSRSFDDTKLDRASRVAR